MWCVIVPTYNNETTVRQVVSDVLRYTRDVIVVNDGCTDGTERQLAALRAGFREARKRGFDYAITIDADGQHFAGDIPAFIEALRAHPDSLIVGSRNLEEAGMPAGNTFANKFSNFWFRLQTGVRLPDTQTGYRLYPLRRMGRLWWLTSRYEAELEMLVYAAWAGVELVPIKVGVYYPPSGMRVTHFRPVYDFVRISLLNTLLCFFAVVYGWPSKLIRCI